MHLSHNKSSADSPPRTVSLEAKLFPAESPVSIKNLFVVYSAEVKTESE